MFLIFDQILTIPGNSIKVDPKLWYKISHHANDRQGDRRFTRIAYIFKDNPDWLYVVIHYRGDESVFVPRPQGLSVTNTRLHERTCSSVLLAIKLKVLQNSCGKVYADNVTSGQHTDISTGYRMMKLMGLYRQLITLTSLSNWCLFIRI